jgi:acyl carrier protein
MAAHVVAAEMRAVLALETAVEAMAPDFFAVATIADAAPNPAAAGDTALAAFVAARAAAWSVAPGRAAMLSLRLQAIDAASAALLARVLASGVPSARILSADAMAPREERPAGATPRPAHPRPDLMNAYVAPRSDLEREITVVWETGLATEPIGVHDSFLELGGNSLLATELVARLNERFELSIPLRSLFDRPTVAGVAELVAGSAEASGSDAAA